MKFNSLVLREVLMWFSAALSTVFAITGYYMNSDQVDNTAIYSLLFFLVLGFISACVALYIRSNDDRYMKPVHFVLSPIHSIISLFPKRK
jgi:predicted membrane channel-forming protein YqfA (hemolysin III family)